MGECRIVLLSEILPPGKGFPYGKTSATDGYSYLSNIRSVFTSAGATYRAGIAHHWSWDNPG
jgi:hypothetical protein